MKNTAERRKFIDDPANWTPVETTKYTRLSRVDYMGESRYKLEVFESVDIFDYMTLDSVPQDMWNLRDYYEMRGGSLKRQSLTEIRQWVADLDRLWGMK